MLKNEHEISPQSDKEHHCFTKFEYEKKEKESYAGRDVEFQDYKD